MLPAFILAEIFSYVDLKSLRELRFACWEFNALVLPLILNSLTFAVPDSLLEYQKFLKKHNKFIKGLKFKSCNQELASLFQNPDFSFSELLPNLRSLEVWFDGKDGDVFSKLLDKECTPLLKLKHLSIRGAFNERVFLNLKTLLSQVPSIFTTEVNKLILYSLFNRVEWPHLKELYLTGAECDGVQLKLIETQFPELKTLRILSILEDPILSFSYDFKTGRTDTITLFGHSKTRFRLMFKDFVTLGMLQQSAVNHSYILTYDASSYENIIYSLGTVLNFPGIKCITLDAISLDGKPSDSLKKILDIPVINIISDSKQAKFPPFQFNAVALSYTMADEFFEQFFDWVCKFFPNLQQLHVHNAFKTHTLPLKGSHILPNLTHFYSSVDQPDNVWPQLLTAAPKLHSIHLKQPDYALDAYEAIRPSLRVKSWHTIENHGLGFNDFSGFNKHIRNGNF